MKLVCECGKEFLIHNPPLFLEISMIVIEHSRSYHQPVTMKAVCQCGAERTIGPGTGNWQRNRDAMHRRGVLDGEWFRQHTACEVV
jgi:hypothetical protein